MVVLNGFVKIHRKLIQWGWYQDNVVKGVFLHLLLTANFKDAPWQGRIIKKGQVVIGTQKMADELGFTRQQIRTAIKKLKSTNEITTEPTNKNTIVTIVNREDYQSLEEKPTNKSTNTLTNHQPTTNQRATNNQPQRKNDKNDKKEKNKDGASLSFLFDEERIKAELRK
jgi:DNA replication protein DnaD